MPVRLYIFGDKQVQINLGRGAAKVEDMSDTLNDIADDMMDVIDATFRSQGRRFGGSWQFLDPAWVKRKVTKGLDPRILYAQDILHSAMTERDHEHQILDVGSHNIELDTDLDYAAVHQYGNDHNPARPFIDFNLRDEQRWADWVAEDVAKVLRGE